MRTYCACIQDGDGIPPLRCSSSSCGCRPTVLMGTSKYMTVCADMGADMGVHEHRPMIQSSPVADPAAGISERIPLGGPMCAERVVVGSTRRTDMSVFGQLSLGPHEAVTCQLRSSNFLSISKLCLKSGKALA